MLLILAIVLFAGRSASGSGLSSSVITTACDLARMVIDGEDPHARFDLAVRCTTIKAEGKALFFKDASGAMYADCGEATLMPAGYRPQPGDLMRLTGKAAIIAGRPRAMCSSVEKIGSGCAPAANPVTGREFTSGKFDFAFVSVRGAVNDIITDEVDPNYYFLDLLCGDRHVLVPRTKNELPPPIGATVSVCGICSPYFLASRRQIGRMLLEEEGTLRILAPPADTPYDAPHLKPFYRLQPEDIVRLPQHKVVGRVLALWNRTQALIADKDGFNVKVAFSATPLPSIGETVEAVGLPETDLYRVNLSHARWRAHPSAITATNESPAALHARDIVRTDNGRLVYDSLLDGRTVRLSGIVRQVPSEVGSDLRLYLDCDARLVPVDLTAAPDAARSLAVGSRVEATGVCILETEIWQPNLVFPKVTGFMIAVRRADDLRLLANPPFWTARRLGGVIVALVLLLLAILLWNRSLRLLANRRGLQLFREKVTTLKANLRVDERTKLAVELHDSLAQSLTGVYMEIETAGEFGEGARPELLAHLQTAAAAVKSCHGELRNCLWDLRNMALEEKDLNAAIRKTLAPHVRNVALAVRFNVPRARLTDNVAHAVLRIIRELAINAVRHGGAKSVKVAGGIDGDVLRLSVRDDGCGFDPDACPGVLQGHFGLEGIRERAGLLGGRLEISSECGRGTKAVVTIRLARAEDARKKTA